MTARTGVMAVGALAVLAGILVAPTLGIADLGGGSFSAWLTEVRGDDLDRGWSRLDAHTRATAYDDDRDAYLDEVMAADWSALELEEPVRKWFDDGLARMEARLISAPATVPPFLFERRIVHGVCESGEPVGIGVFEHRRFLGSGGFTGGGVTGSQARCNAAFFES